MSGVPDVQEALAAVKANPFTFTGPLLPHGWASMHTEDSHFEASCTDAGGRDAIMAAVNAIPALTAEVARSHAAEAEQKKAEALLRSSSALYFRASQALDEGLDARTILYQVCQAWEQLVTERAREMSAAKPPIIQLEDSVAVSLLTSRLRALQEQMAVAREAMDRMGYLSCQCGRADLKAVQQALGSVPEPLPSRGLGRCRVCGELTPPYGGAICTTGVSHVW